MSLERQPSRPLLVVGAVLVAAWGLSASAELAVGAAALALEVVRELRDRSERRKGR